MTPLPRLSGRLHYLQHGSSDPWGFEEWSITTGADGVRTLAAHCELDLDGEHIARDSIQREAVSIAFGERRTMS